MHGWTWFVGWGLTRTVTEPFTAYVTTHSVGLPASPGLLIAAWAIGAGVLLLFSVGGHRGARLGWTIYGVMTTAAVWAGAPAGGRWVAAGVVVGGWAVLSILAFDGMMRRRDRTVITVNTAD